MAVFDVDKISSHVPSNFGGADVIFDQKSNFAVGPDLIVAGDVKLSIQDWVAVSHSWLEPEFIVGLAKPAGVGKLKTNDQVVGGSIALAMGGQQDLSNFSEVGLVLLANDQLIWVGAAIGPYRHCFTTENQFCATFTEALP